MKPEDLYHEGRVEETVEVLGTDLRADPTNVQKRTFLFELLCFAGEYERARKHLDVLASNSKDAMMGALMYQGALNAEITRREMFEQKTFPAPPGENLSVGGILNGRPFESIRDSDPRIGDRLEVLAAGDYLWIAFRDIARLEMDSPKRLRDLLWSPAKLGAGPTYRNREIGEVLIPALCPLSSQHSDDKVRLGRVTEWCQDEDGEEAPYGRKTLLIDGEEFPLSEIRTLEIAVPANQI